MNMQSDPHDDDTIRLQLAIARAGVASRRHAEELIAAGRVKVNGAVVSAMGARVTPGRDTVEVDGRPIPAQPQERVTVLLNKPAGWLSAASDGHGGRVVTDLVEGVAARLVPAGRLDKDSQGLLILSSDGDLIASLTHPRGGHAKTYSVEVSGRCDAAALATLRGEMVIDGYRLRPVEVEPVRRAGAHSVLRFVLHEGRNRQIRKMCAQAGLNVVRLVRVAIDDLTLGDLRPGEWRRLTPAEVRALKRPGPAATPAKRQGDAPAPRFTAGRRATRR